MAGARFRFSGLLLLRRSRRAKAEADFGRARAQAARASAALDELSSRLHELRAASPIHPDAAANCAAHELQRLAAFAAQHARRVRELCARLAQAERECESARADLERAQLALAQASVQVRAVERLRLRVDQMRWRKREASEQDQLHEQIESRRRARTKD